VDWDSTLASQLGCVSGSRFHTHLHSTVFPLCSLNLRGMISPQKVATRVFHWELIRPDSPSASLGRPIQTQALTGSAPLTGSRTLPGSIVHPGPSPRLTRRTSPSSGSSCPLAPGGSFSGWSRGCTPGTREVRKSVSAIPALSPQEMLQET
jgi:hypothetical protein